MGIFLPICSWVLTEWLHIGGEFNPLCVCGTEATVSFQACSPWVLPCCCHFFKKNPFNKQAETCTYSTTLSPLNDSVILVTIVTFLVLNHFATSSISRTLTSVFLVSVSSTLEGFLETLGEIALLKCTLYVFQNLWEDPRHSHISSHLTDGLLSFSSYLIIVAVRLLKYHIIMQCYKSFKDEYTKQETQPRDCTRLSASKFPSHLLVLLLLNLERLLLPPSSPGFFV